MEDKEINESEEKFSWKQEAKEWIEAIAFGVIAIMLIHKFVAEPYMVDGPSMNPTLQSHERVIVNKMTYKFGEPEKGDVVVFEYQRDRSRTFIKRVIANAGDTIEIAEGKVYVNDQLLEEDYILDTTQTEYPKITVPQGTVFVMGDNRNNSLDSRSVEVGFVPLELIKGKASLILWPLGNFNFL
jgi:signal peptidase I